MRAFAHERQLTGLDHARLSSLLNSSRTSLPASLADTAREVIDTADIVDSTAIAPTVVTMRTRARLRRPGGDELEVVLCYPEEANAAEGRISVLSPLGLSLLGATAGQTIEWQGPDGEVHRAQIDQIVFQPEAAGDYLS